MEKLGISLSYFISQLINFGLLVALLYVLLYRPLQRLFQERRERIVRSLQDADAARENAAKAQQEYEQRVAEAQRKGQEIIAQATQVAEQSGAEIRSEAMRQREEILQKARQEAEAEKQRILSEVQGQIASLSLMATERVLGQGLDENVQRKLIDQFLADLGNNGKAVPGAVRDVA